MEGDAAAMQADLNAQFAALNEQIQKVFKAFDKDNSNFIDLNELRDVSAELGRPMDAAELEECMKDLDTNKDGKISFEEFSQWWLSGRQGLAGWMRRLLIAKQKTLKFVDSISGQIQEVVTEATTGNQTELSTKSLHVAINDTQNAGTTLNAKLMLLSPEAKSWYTHIPSVHSW